MRRGDIVVLADRTGRYTGKPRPALVVQADLFSGTNSVVVCLITSAERDAALLRIALAAGERTGLERPSWVQIDKITAVERSQASRQIGAADACSKSAACSLASLGWVRRDERGRERRAGRGAVVESACLRGA
ncbi:MAG: type II toxin-antitoxin system PemK/MazF family toxin [Acetobacteraceae bacterium]|nr:type II toxin-antitoxin system PemK/MazF family toxin [Acetobacteraceae bacterium]